MYRVDIHADGGNERTFSARYRARWNGGVDAAGGWNSWNKFTLQRSEDLISP
jgi:hypothetical protein